MSEENCQKNLRAMGKSLKQLETDVKNAENDKMADPSDQFVPVMSISLQTTASQINLAYHRRHHIMTLY